MKWHDMFRSNSYISMNDIFNPGFLSMANTLRSHLCLCMLSANSGAAAGRFKNFQPRDPAHLSFSLFDTHTAPSLSPHNLNMRTPLSSRHPPRLQPPPSPTCRRDTNQPCVMCQNSPGSSCCVVEALREASAFPPSPPLVDVGFARSSGFAGQRCDCP